MNRSQKKHREKELKRKAKERKQQKKELLTKSYSSWDDVPCPFVRALGKRLAARWPLEYSSFLSVLCDRFLEESLDLDKTNQRMFQLVDFVVRAEGINYAYASFSQTELPVVVDSATAKSLAHYLGAYCSEMLYHSQETFAGKIAYAESIATAAAEGKHGQAGEELATLIAYEERLWPKTAALLLNLVS